MTKMTDFILTDNFLTKLTAVNFIFVKKKKKLMLRYPTKNENEFSFLNK